MMKNCLYFICPTDYLESIIESTFRQENYFYSSLGNSVAFGNYELKQIKKLIRTRNISTITFVLSDNNRIVLDALGNQEFSNIRGLKKTYSQVLQQKEHLDSTWQTLNPERLILSSFLNIKIKEFKNRLSDLFTNQLTISGKVYNKKENKFDDIYSELICQEELIMN